METIRVNIPGHEYDIRIERGILKKIGEECDFNRRVLVVTDKGVPREYAETVAAQAKQAVIAVIDGGEEGKTLDAFARLQQVMLDNGFSRKDCVAAVGGGVVGDVAAFAASCYMRGIQFYNIPTTVLSQVDSSIGGKTGVNFGGVKNIVGSFYQPSKVIIDPEVLSSLDRRQQVNGFAEAIKMALTFDAKLFEDIEAMDASDDMMPYIVRAIDIKRRVVEEDEKEAGLRKVLNFGHTLGHGIEVSCGGRLLHGECVAAGMTAMCAPEVRDRLGAVLRKFGLPESADFDLEHAAAAVSHDKKGNGRVISSIYVPEVGSFEIRDMSPEEARERLELILRK
ncbi:MAG: 3-dehydroquinate synthase [Lachnospiraceae bacterium]|nr:3-dehydroquinate synthase [Lachnospiraceae bacterium]